MAEVFLTVATTLASLSIPASWSRECSQLERRVFFVKAGYVTSFWNAHERCTELGGNMAVFSGGSMKPKDRMSWMKNISDTFIIGGRAFGNNNILRWYADKHMSFTKALPWGHAEPKSTFDHKCIFVNKGIARTGKCHSWETNSVRALCQLSDSEKKYQNAKCTLCLCPGAESPSCKKDRCDLPCVELVEGQECVWYPCKQNEWNPPKCDKTCMCKDDCDSITGKCRGECIPGWYGDGDSKSCNRTKFDAGKFHHYETHNLTGCACRGDAWCTFSGLCVSCWPGAGGNYCAESDCPIRRYGRDCEKTCHCADPVKCAQEQGHCLQMPFKGCSGKWLGRSCTETICSTGLFGPDCQYICACKYGEQCDLDSGHCAAGCEDGWMGPSCNDTLCPVGKYGTKCRKDCVGCELGENCNHETGRCLSSYINKRSACEDLDKYGYNCDKNCTFKVVGLCTGCDRDFGDRCGECKYGYHLNADGLCQECPDNTFGIRCRGSCDVSCPKKGYGCNKFKFKCYEHCQRMVKTTCNNICSLPCPDGTFCDAGRTNSCQVCAKGRFGFNCARLCSHVCGPGVDCDVVNGLCAAAALPKRPFSIAEQCYPDLMDKTVSIWLPFWTVLPAICVVCPMVLFAIIFYFKSENTNIIDKYDLEEVEEEEEEEEEEEDEEDEEKGSRSDSSQSVNSSSSGASDGSRDDSSRDSDTDSESEMESDVENKKESGRKRRDKESGKRNNKESDNKEGTTENTSKIVNEGAKEAATKGATKKETEA
ncbi:multiple epidermal growth factor-like domains protein 11 [Aplysia californica]|uniref:Multiple epidermal growth factor-like domains protein 11 n=1 Tax=Aplysia californica TaxID=6500 RepID=A0ABM0K304_APLCA|nr:multiple epidermal growth factor-like domains protein 11 [Aplysia californica]XP_005107574.1 multiple epidermal growth factor-like domains protein 11 [Aplysia californica]